MKPIRKILAPTDLSRFSAPSVRYALDLAKAIGAEVTVCHVIDPEKPVELQKNRAGNESIARVIAKFIGTALNRYVETRAVSLCPQFRSAGPSLDSYRTTLRQFLTDSFSDLISTVNVQEKVERGTPAEAIVEIATKQGVDLIVMSTHGRTALAHIVMGSVTEKVIHNARCPVLAIRPESSEKREEPRAAA
jgi:nucleotide-binding universal stress UspA family protein